MRIILSIAVLFGLAGAGSYYYLKYVRSESVSSFRTEPVQRGLMLPTIGATGTFEPEEVVDIGAQVAGLIEELKVDYGSAVEKGTVLARIDDTKYRAVVDQAAAALASAKASVDLAKANVANADAMVRRDDLLEKTAPAALVPSQFDIDKAADGVARAQVGVAEASVGQATALLKSAQTDLDYTIIKSPVKGIIIDRRVNVGQTVVSSLSAPSLFLLAKDLTRIQIWASVNEADIGRIRVKQKATFTVDTYPGEVFHGEVSQIRLNASMTQNVVTYTVVVTTENKDLRLKPYMTANVNFEIERHDGVLKAPNAALRWKPRPEQIAPDIRAQTLKSMDRRSGKSKHGDADKTAEDDGKASASAASASPGEGKKAQAAQSSPAGTAAMKTSGGTATGTKPEDWKARTEMHKQKGGKPAETAAAAQSPPAAAAHQPPGKPLSPQEAKAAREHYESGYVWKVDGNFVRPVKVKIIATDGTMTEIRGKDIQEDDLVVVGENLASDSGDDTTNPFVPKFHGKGRK